MNLDGPTGFFPISPFSQPRNFWAKFEIPVPDCPGGPIPVLGSLTPCLGTGHPTNQNGQLDRVRALFRAFSKNGVLWAYVWYVRVLRLPSPDVVPVPRGPSVMTTVDTATVLGRAGPGGDTMRSCSSESVCQVLSSGSPWAGQDS